MDNNKEETKLKSCSSYLTLTMHLDFSFEIIKSLTIIPSTLSRSG